MLTRELIYEYERTLLGNKKEISSHFFLSDYYKEELAIELIKYAIKTYLRWDDERASACLKPEHIECLKLTQMLSYISYPPEIDPETDFFYFVSKLYPDKIVLDFRELTLNIYKKVLDGRLPRFPKGFFDAGKGVLRAVFCLQYAINQNLLFSSIEEGYAYFATGDANKFLREKKLYVAITTIFETPLDYYHETLNEDEKSEYWLQYYKYEKNISKIKQ